MARLRVLWPLAALAPCAVVFKEHGVLYARPYEREVRLRIRSLRGRRLGEALQSDEAIFENVAPEWCLEELRKGHVRVERSGWQLDLNYLKLQCFHVFLP